MAKGNRAERLQRAAVMLVLACGVLLVLVAVVAPLLK